MGAVYVALQRGTNKERALKVMLPELVNDPRSRERFLQEARAGSAIESDHIVEVIAAGIDDATGAPWIAMELLRGETLAQAIEKRGPLSASHAHECLGQGFPPAAAAVLRFSGHWEDLAFGAAQLDDFRLP